MGVVSLYRGARLLFVLFFLVSVVSPVTGLYEFFFRFGCFAWCFCFCRSSILSRRFFALLFVSTPSCYFTFSTCPLVVVSPSLVRALFLDGVSLVFFLGFFVVCSGVSWCVVIFLEPCLVYGIEGSERLKH